MKKYPLALSIALMVAGLLAFIFYLYFFVGISDIIEVFSRVNPYNYSLFYSITIIAMVLSMLFYAMSWNTLLRALSIDTGLKKAFIYCWLGNFVDLIVPIETVSGEIVRAYLIHRDYKDAGRIAAAIISHRIITIFVTASSMLIASIILIFKYKVSVGTLCLLVATIAGSIALIILLLYVSLSEGAAEIISNALTRIASSILGRSRLDPSKVREKMYRGLIQLHGGFKSIGRKRRILIKSVAFSFIAWALHLSVYLLVFYALGFSEVSTKIIESIVVYTISVTVQSAPISLPLGLVEIVMTDLYKLFNIPAAIGGTATLLIRTVTFWLQVAVGYALAQLIGVKEIIERGSKKTSTC